MSFVLSVVDALIASLTDLFINGEVYLGTASEEVEGLCSDLVLLKKLVEDVHKEKQVEGKMFHDWLVEIAKIAYDAEDLISLEVNSKRKSNFARILSLVTDHGVLKERFSLVRQKIKHLIGVKDILFQVEGRSKEYYSESGTTSSEVRERVGIRRKRKDIVVGLDEDIEKLVKFTVKDENCLRISIVGMGGLGKTTLAQKVYQHTEVRRHFNDFAWVSLGKHSDATRVLRDILMQLDPEMSEELLNAYSNLELCQQIHKIQLSERCLVVLDDVWSVDFWENICIAFPSKDKCSKLLVTTRVLQLTHYLQSKIYEMNPLSDWESWELFVRKEFEIGSPDIEKNKIAKYLLRTCKGLPLAINVLGGLLESKHTLEEWRMIFGAMESYQVVREGGLQTLPLLSLCYNYLSADLKPCFLYLGIFPEDSDIEVEILYQMWMAEGFISSENEGDKKTMMDTAEEYLDELAARGLVDVREVEVPSLRLFKSCHLHDLIRELCLYKAKEETLFDVIDSINIEGKFTKSISKTHRLAMYINMSYESYERNELAFPLKDPASLRSLLFLKTNQYMEMLAKFPQSWDFNLCVLLRVLNFEGFDFRESKYLGEIGKICSLHYLSFRGCGMVKLPLSIGHLLNLQTLDLRVLRDCAVTIPDVIWQLKMLKHLYFPLMFHVYGSDKLRLDGLTNLETLEMFDTRVCSAIDLLFLTNLRNLAAATEGNLEDLECIIKGMNMTSNYFRQSSLQIRNFNINCLEKRHVAIKLFECQTLHKLHIKGYIGELPNIISSSLTQLIFIGSELVYDPMPTLERFPNLWILELGYRAFLGKKMFCSALGFRQLRHLTLSNLHNLETLMVEEGAMPNLSTLTIEGCESLEVLPRFQELNIKGKPQPSGTVGYGRKIPF